MGLPFFIYNIISKRNVSLPLGVMSVWVLVKPVLSFTNSFTSNKSSSRAEEYGCNLPFLSRYIYFFSSRNLTNTFCLTLSSFAVSLMFVSRWRSTRSSKYSAFGRITSFATVNSETLSCKAVNYPSSKADGLLVRVYQRTQHSRAIPVVPTVLLFLKNA